MNTDVILFLKKIPTTKNRPSEISLIAIVRNFLLFSHFEAKRKKTRIKYSPIRSNKKRKKKKAENKAGIGCVRLHFSLHLLV